MVRTLREDLAISLQTEYLFYIMQNALSKQAKLLSPYTLSHVIINIFHWFLQIIDAIERVFLPDVSGILNFIDEKTW